MKKFIKTTLGILVLQIPLSSAFAAGQCGSSAYQYALQFCEKTTGVIRGKSQSVNSLNCYWAADYMEAHPQTRVDDVETTCKEYAPYSSSQDHCQMAMWAYIRARK